MRTTAPRQHRTRLHERPFHGRRGMALVLVVGVMALATVLSLAMLTSASLQSQAKATQNQAAEAQLLAESGVNLGIYYLQNPTKAPVLVSNVYPGQTGVTFGSSVDGSVDIAVTTVGADLYDVSATASAGPAAGTRISRQVRSRVYVNRAYVIDNAASFITNATIPALMTINGDVRCDGNLTNNGTITGKIESNTLAGNSGSSLKAIPTYPTRAAPTMSQLSLNTTLGAATPYYTYVDSNGATQTGYAELLPATVSGPLTPSATNPKSVWYANANVTLDNCTIDGTIFIRGAGRYVTVKGITRITPRANMPGLLVGNSIKFQSDATVKKLTVDGLCYTGNQIATTGLAATNCELVVNGAFMAAGPSSAIVSAQFSGSVTVNFVPDNVQVPELSTVNTVPKSIKIVQWGT